MLGEESESADYWKKCGDEALARNIQGVIIMVLPSFSPPSLPSLPTTNTNTHFAAHRAHTGTL